MDQVVGVGAGQRGQAGHAVTEHFGGDPAKPEHHNRSEHRFLHDADDGLDAAGDHRLDEHSGHPPGELGRQMARADGNAPCCAGPLAQPLPVPLRYQHLLEGIEVLNAFARAEHN